MSASTAERDDERVEFDEGFHLPEAPHLPDDEEIARWSMERGLIRLRVADGPVARVALRIVSLAPRTLRLQSGASVVEAAIDTTPTWIEIDVDPVVFDVINNVGSNLYRHGFGGDRGFLERDIGQYEEPVEVFAWCGGAVLLRRGYLDDVGMFDEELFLYYEDTDLSWRGRLRGWRYQYVPTSVIRHRHAQSSGVWSPTFRFYTERNRMLVLAKNAPARLALRAILGAVKRLVVTFLRQVVLRPFVLRLPVRAEASHQWRVVRSYAGKLPAMVRARRSARPSVDRGSLLSWMVTK